MCGQATSSLLAVTLCFICGFSAKQQQVYIGVLAEKNTSGNIVDAYSIGECALALINNSTLILPDYHLLLIRGNGGCADPPGLSPFLAAGVLAVTSQNPAVIGLVGPLCSSSAAFLGPLVGREELSLVNLHLGVSTHLEDRTGFPNSFGIVGSSSVFLHTVMELIRMNRWRVVNILYDDSQLYHASSLYALDHSMLDNFTAIEYFISSTLTNIPLDDIKLQSRIIVLFMREELARKVLCRAYNASSIFPAYQFVIISLDSPTSMLNTPVSFTELNSKNYFCSTDELAVAIDGAVFVSFETSGSITDHLYRTKNCSSFEEYVSICQERQPSTFTYLFDAYWSLALALHNSHLKPEDLIPLQI